MFDLKYFGVIFSDSDDRDNNACQTLHSVVLVVTAAVMTAILPFIALELDFDDWSKAFSTPMSLLVCSTIIAGSLISRAVVTYNVCRHKYRKYKATLQAFDIYIPTNAVDAKHIERFSVAVVFLCISTILPINGLKLYYIFANHSNPVLMTTYFGVYYLHNLSMACAELHFAIQCFVVYTKFRDINNKLIQINDEQVDRHSYNVRFPFIVANRLTAAATYPVGGRDASSPLPRTIVYEKDFYRPMDETIPLCPLANTIELLRIKHWLTREAVNDLKDLFGLRMGLSIVCLATPLLIDVYTEVFYSNTNNAATYDKPVFRSKLLFCGWLLQYTLRFCIIVMPAHTATKQAVKIKKLITEMNNRYLDKSTKEELHLFYNQLSAGSPEFTIFDVFTINNSLITSAIAAGSTYILILVQIHSEK